MSETGPETAAETAPSEDDLRAITIICTGSGSRMDVQPMWGQQPDPDVRQTDTVSAASWLPFDNPVVAGEYEKLYRVEPRSHQRRRRRELTSKEFSRTLPFLIYRCRGGVATPEQVMAAAAVVDWQPAGGKHRFSVACLDGQEATLDQILAASRAAS